jgi:methionine salvage enolase-phosphatase E1
MGNEIREMDGKIALHVVDSILERKLKKLKSYIYSTPYYDSSSGKIVGVDMFFEKSARNTLKKLVDDSQLPLF